MDYGHKMADDELQKLERKLKREYKKAYQEVKKKADAYLKQFEEEDKKKKALVDAGELTEKEYKKWRQDEMMMNRRWESLKNSLSEEMNETSRYANGEIYQHSANVFAENYNFAQYEISAVLDNKIAINANASFTLYDKNTVLNLAKNKPDLLPKPGKKTSEAIAQKKIKKWRNQTLQSVMMQGILQGLSIPDIADRLASSLAIKDMNVAIRTARTMTTSAENAGRIEGYKHADDLGIKMNKAWIATLDSRTRHSHRQLDGVSIPKEEKFENGLKFPADPGGAPGEVYNCRCTLVADFPDYKTNFRDMNLRNTDRMQEEDYQKWKDALKKKKEAPSQKSAKKKPFDRTKVTFSTFGQKIKDLCTLNNVPYKEVKELKEKLSEEEIIKRISGGDMTSGSCASLAWSYIGNKLGLDVLDFRGGSSLNVFSTVSSYLAKMEGVVTITAKGGGIRAAKKLLNQMEEGKQYILSTGRHSAIVRLVDGKIQFLELQSADDSGWKDFEEEDKIWWEGTPWEEREKRNLSWRLKNRFACDRATGRKESYLIDIESLEDSDEFRELLGYINTDKSKQRKGRRGHER